MPRAGLTSERVVAVAGELIDSQGLEALSLSAVAHRLGVKSPSLYAHIGGLDDLHERLARAGGEQLADALAPAAAGLSRGDALIALGRAYRSWALAHPGLYATIAATGPRREPSFERVLELVLAVLRGYGLEGDGAIHAARSVRAALHGFITLESRGGFAIPVDPEQSFDWMLAALDHGLAAAHA